MDKEKFQLYTSILDPATVSKWCTNTLQPNLETIVEIAKLLEVDIKDLFRPINEQ